MAKPNGSSTLFLSHNPLPLLIAITITTLITPAPFASAFSFTTTVGTTLRLTERTTTSTSTTTVTPTTTSTSTTTPTPTITTPTTTTPRISTCTLPGGKVLAEVTKDKPVIISSDVKRKGKGKVIKYGCLKCYCDEQLWEQYLKKGGKGPVPKAKCPYMACPDPRCVDPVRVEGQCCPICPNGENCYVTLTREELEQQEKDCQIFMKKNKKDDDKKKRSNRWIKKNRTRVIPAGKFVAIGDRVCRCEKKDPKNPKNNARYDLNAVCKPLQDVVKF